MAYLITHIAIFLVAAQLLGLLLGWLLWGYLARQRGVELQALQARLSAVDLAPRRPALATEPLTALPLTSGIEPAAPPSPTPPALSQRALIQDDLAAPVEPQPLFLPDATLPPPLPDLKAEVQEAKLQHYEKQVRELEGVRDRLPQLQSQLDESAAARRNLERELAESTTRFEVRIDDLSRQIREFEQAAFEWDRMRDEWDYSRVAADKELAGVKAHLRDLQNNQLPQKADAPEIVTISPLEHADLRERYQKAVLERDALLAQAAGPDGGVTDPHARLVGLEELLRAKESALADQASQVETLLWRVAELEPLAASVPKMEENLSRLDSEISGHVAMHAESSEHIRTLLNRVAELEGETAAMLAEQTREAARLSQERGEELERWQQLLSEKEAALQQFSANQGGLQKKLHRAEELRAELEKTNAAQLIELKGLREHYASQSAELERMAAGIAPAQARLAETTRLLEKLPTLEKTLAGQTAEIGRLQASLQAAEASRQSLQDEREQATKTYDADIRRLTDLTAGREREWQASLAGQAAEAATLQANLQEAETSRNRLQEELVQAIATRDTEIRRLKNLTEEREHEWQAAQAVRAAETERLQSSLQEAEATRTRLQAEMAQTVEARDAEIRLLTEITAERERDLQAAHAALEQASQTEQDLRFKLDEAREEWRMKELQLGLMLERINELSTQLANGEARLRQLEPIAAKAPEFERKLTDLETRHKAERTQLQVSSAQRLRRLRQSITNFKG